MRPDSDGACRSMPAMAVQSSQKGWKASEPFQDEVSFIVPGGTEAYAISFWQSKEKADAYARTGYPEVLKTLAKVVEGTPQLQNAEVSNSTFHHIAAPRN